MKAPSSLFSLAAVLTLAAFFSPPAALAAPAPAPAPSPLFLRVALSAPQDHAWRVHIVVRRPNETPKGWFAGKTVGETAAAAELAPAGAPSAWVDATETAAIAARGATVC